MISICFVIYKRALLNNREKLPERRREELTQLIRAYYGVQEVDGSLLQDAAKIDAQ